MSRLGNGRHDSFFSAQALLIALLFLLPSIFPLLLAWTSLMLAVPTFLLFQTEKSERMAVRHLGSGLLSAAAGSMLLGEIAGFVFSLTLLPLGYSLHRSLRQGTSPAAAGGTGILVLGMSWIVFWLVVGASQGTNPYASLLAALDGALEETTAFYRTSPNGSIPADVLYNLELLAAGVRGLLPKVLPGLLAALLVLIVWLNMVTGNRLLRRLRPSQAVWAEFKCWQLPDSLVWLLIVAVALSILGAGRFEAAGYSLTVVAALLYFLQGAAVFVHLLNRWNVPAFWRFFLYVVMAAQSYGVLLLAVTGVADIWADFRSLARNERSSD